MIAAKRNLGDLTKIRTGKLDANASAKNGEYPFFTCARQPLRIDSYTYDCECVLVAGNGDLNVKYYDGKFDAYQRTYIVESRPESKDDLHLRYAYHFLETYLETLREQSIGGIIKYIKLGNLTEAQIPLPPLAEQKRIAAILDVADALRAKRRESLAQLDTLLQSTFLDIFGDPVTNPKGWDVLPLGNLLEEKSVNGAYYPKEAYSDSGVRMVHMADAFYGLVDVEKVKRVNAPADDVVKYGLRPTDILVSRRSLNYEGSAKPCRIPELEEPLIFESSMIRVRPDLSRVLTIYLYHYLQNERSRKKYVFPLVTRSTISGINQTNLMKVRIILPSLDLQRRFAAIVESVEQQKAPLRDHLAELDTLFASLQQRAFNGEL